MLSESINLLILEAFLRNNNKIEEFAYRSKIRVYVIINYLEPLTDYCGKRITRKGNISYSGEYSLQQQGNLIR